MASGFKGTRPGLTRLTLEGSFVETTVTFSDEEGKVHGYMNHKLSTGENPEIQEAAIELLRVTLRALENYHYENPDNPQTTKEVSRGIAEALRGEPDTSDPLGSEEEG